MARETVNTWITAREVAVRFRISRTTLWDWVREGILPAPHHMRSRAVWRSSEIDSAESKLITPPAPRAA